MSKTKYAVLAALTALWATVFVFAESFVGGLVVLLLGTFIFLKVEHWLIHIVASAKKKD